MASFLDAWSVVPDAISSGAFDPQGANSMTNLGTPSGFNSRFPDITTNAINISSPNWGGLPNTSEMDFGYLNSTPATSEKMGSFFSDDTQSKANGWFNYGASKITGLPSGNTGGVGPNPSAAGSPAGAALTSFDFSGYFVRATVIILGFIFVAAGLYMFG